MHRPDRPLDRRERRRLVTRRSHLLAEAEALDAEHGRSARRMAHLRRELGRLRTVLWPNQPGRGWRGFRRPRVGGPAPVGPTAPDALPVRGRSLRYAAVGVLVRAGEPLALPDIHRRLHLAGYRIDGAHQVKQLADALGYEHRCGRARRTERGVYGVGQLSPARRRATATRPPRP
jgi:hypothetical protein